MDLSDTIIPKSDQLNADDLLTGPITVTVTAVRRGDKEQPVSIGIDGGRQPYKPCKSMRRALIAVWGNDGAKWVGRRMTLYCDPEVKYGGVKVGGIRISHVSHIENDVELMLTVTRGRRVAFLLRAMRDEKPEQAPNRDVRALLGTNVRDALKKAMAARDVKVQAMSDALTWLNGLDDTTFAAVKAEVVGNE